MERKTQELFDAVLNPDDRKLTREELSALCRDADGLLCTVGDPVDAALIGALPDRLRVIASFSVGVDHIDIDARARGSVSSQFTACYYAASKAGIIGFSRVLARELAPFGITVNTVAPTRIDTDMAKTFSNLESVKNAYLDAIPLRRIGQPVDVANCVAFLAFDEAAFMTGSIIDLTGGQYMP